MLMVGTDAARVEQDLRAGRLSCPEWGKFGIRAIFPYKGFRPEKFTLLDGKFMF